MKWIITPFVALAGLAPVAVPARQSERVRCVIDDGRPQPCRMSIVTRGGVRHMTFRLGNRQVKFVGRAQTGWWSGRLDGKSAMGFERNRGHVVYSTNDLSRSFAWFYPGSEHGTY